MNCCKSNTEQELKHPGYKCVQNPIPKSIIEKLRKPNLLSSWRNAITMDTMKKGHDIDYKYDSSFGEVERNHEN